MRFPSFRRHRGRLRTALLILLGSPIALVSLFEILEIAFPWFSPGRFFAELTGRLFWPRPSWALPWAVLWFGIHLRIEKGAPGGGTKNFQAPPPKHLRQRGFGHHPLTAPGELVAHRVRSGGRIDLWWPCPAVR